MNSIKEMAALYALNYRMSCISREGGFIAGANFVLDKIKILLNSQRFVDNPSQELFELIEQLKK